MVPVYPGREFKIIQDANQPELALRVRIFFMHRPVQRKYAAKAAHGPRGEQGENLPYSISECV